MEGKFYQIVRFAETKEVEVVSTMWLFVKDEKRFCWWPPFESKNDYRKLLSNHSEPVDSLWSHFEVSLIDGGRKFASLPRALKNCNLASDLPGDGDMEFSSENEELGRFRRRRQVQTTYPNDADDDNSDGECQAPQPPAKTGPAKRGRKPKNNAGVRKQAGPMAPPPPPPPPASLNNRLEVRAATSPHSSTRSPLSTSTRQNVASTSFTNNIVARRLFAPLPPSPTLRSSSESVRAEVSGPHLVYPNHDTILNTGSHEDPDVSLPVPEPTDSTISDVMDTDELQNVASLQPRVANAPGTSDLQNTTQDHSSIDMTARLPNTTAELLTHIYRGVMVNASQYRILQQNVDLLIQHTGMGGTILQAAQKNINLPPVVDELGDSLIPVSSDETLEKLVEWTRKDKLHKESLLQKMRRNCGLQIVKATRKGLKVLMHDAYAKNYSWLGSRGGKKQFRGSWLCSILNDAVTGIPRFSEIDDAEDQIKHWAQIWLKEANRRMKTRALQARRNMEEEEEST